MNKVFVFAPSNSLLSALEAWTESVHWRRTGSRESGKTLTTKRIDYIDLTPSGACGCLKAG